MVETGISFWCRQKPVKTLAGFAKGLCHKDFQQLSTIDKPGQNRPFSDMEMSVCAKRRAGQRVAVRLPTDRSP